LQFLEHRRAPRHPPLIRYLSAKSTRTKVTNQARTLIRVEDDELPDYFATLPSATDALRANLSRILEYVPDEVKPGPRATKRRLKCLSPSAQRKTLQGLSTPTLATLDEIGNELHTPPWLLVHPEMKKWDKDRDRIMFIVRRFLEATPKGQETLMGVARELRKIAATV
jgi:hypothetical protein